MPRINLLPWREQQRVERKKAFGVGMFGAFVGALAVAAVGWLLVNQMMDAQRDRNNLLRAEIKVLDKQIEEINDLEQQKQQHIARIQIIESLQSSRSEIVRVFDAMPKLIPDGVYLTSLQQTGNRFTMRGLTQSPTRVSTFIRSIDGSGLLVYDGLGPIATGRDTGTSANFTMYSRLASAQPAAAK